MKSCQNPPKWLIEFKIWKHVYETGTSFNSLKSFVILFVLFWRIAREPGKNCFVRACYNSCYISIWLFAVQYLNKFTEPFYFSYFPFIFNFRICSVDCIENWLQMCNKKNTRKLYYCFKFFQNKHNVWLNVWYYRKFINIFLFDSVVLGSSWIPPKCSYFILCYTFRLCRF